MTVVTAAGVVDVGAVVTDGEMLTVEVMPEGPLPVAPGTVVAEEVPMAPTSEEVEEPVPWVPEVADAETADEVVDKPSEVSV